jgi:hypothetical protein
VPFKFVDGFDYVLSCDEPRPPIPGDKESVGGAVCVGPDLLSESGRQRPVAPSSRQDGSGIPKRTLQRARREACDESVDDVF